MAYNFEYPYVDAGRYNDDWLINKMKELVTEFNNLDQKFDSLSAEFAALKAYVQNYFDNLDLTAEVRQIINEMVASGEFQRIVGEFISYFPVNVKEMGAKGDGVTDDTSVIQAARALAIRQKRALYFPEGTYGMTAPLFLWNNADIFGDGNSMIKALSEYTHLIEIPQSEYTPENHSTTNVSIRNLRLNGNNKIIGHGIRALVCNNWLLENLQIEACGTYGIAFECSRVQQDPIRKGSAVNIRILNCRFRHGGSKGDGDAIDIKDGVNIFIDQVSVDSWTDGGIDARVDHCVISNCLITKCRTGIRLRSDYTAGGTIRASVNNCRCYYNTGNEIAVMGENLQTGQSARYQVEISNCDLIHNVSDSYALIYNPASNTRSGIIRFSSNTIKSNNAVRIYGGTSLENIVVSDTVVNADSAKGYGIDNSNERVIVNGMVVDNCVAVYKSSVSGEASAVQLVASGTRSGSLTEGTPPTIISPLFQ